MISKPRLVRAVTSDLGVLVLIAVARILVHTLTNGQYGFHRDELATLDDGRHLTWGYVAYPPLTPLVARIALELFGTSQVGLRFFATVAQGAVMVLTGLMAREFGAKRGGQIVAAVAAAIAPVSLAQGTMLQYVSFDYLWWVLIAYFVVRLLRSEDQRWWLAIGAVVGLGMQTKYTMGFLIAGMLAGLMFTDARRHLRSPWLWLGVAVSVVVYLPNFLWQMQHNFIHLEFLRSIHARDVALGRGKAFLVEQLYVASNMVTVPLWIAGLYYYFVAPEGRRYRLLGWIYVGPLVLFVFARARGYYLTPGYPMLLAAGAAWGERWVSGLTAARAVRVRRAMWQALLISGLISAAVTLPIAPINSRWWRIADAINGNFNEEIGWPELTRNVARAYSSLPEQERVTAGIMAGDAGQAGALNLLGPAYGLPTAFSGSNSNWLRGYGDPAPQTVITVGVSRKTTGAFESCELVGHLENPFGLKNSTTVGYEEIFVCRHLRKQWPEFWKTFHYFG